MVLLLIGSGVRWYKSRQLSQVLSVRGGELELPITDSIFYQQPTPDNPLNINTADQLHIEMLPGIGPVKAESIIRHREKHGRFEDADDLMDVYGIGPKTVSQIRKLIITE